MLASLAGENKALDKLGAPKKAFIIVHEKPRDNKKSAADFAADVAKKLESQPGLGSAADLMGAMGGSAGKVIQVQYNPASLRFTADASPVDAPKLQENVNREVVSQHTRPQSILMSVELIFDAMHPRDCFFSDDLRLSAGDGLSVGAAAAGLSRKFTVQPQTNGLLTMAMLTKYKNVTFYWASVVFSGEVREARASYTMFAMNGQPVRSHVQLTILQNIVGADRSYWKKAFDACFGGGL